MSGSSSHGLATFQRVQHHFYWNCVEIGYDQENALVIANTLFQKTRDNSTWTLPDDQYWNQIDYILYSQRWGSSIQSAKTRPGADCDSDHELLNDKFKLKLKKVGKTTRPFRYEVWPKSNPLCLYSWSDKWIQRIRSDRQSACGWRFVTLYRRQWSRSSPRKKTKKGKMVVWGGFTNNWEKREAKGKGEKERYTHTNLEFEKKKKKQGKKAGLPQWSMQRNWGKQ